MSLRPSYFEMVAAARLILGLKPALQYVLNFVGRFHPRLGLLGASTNEIFFALLYLIERHYLSNFDGSFSENFYGLKRDRVEGATGKQTGLLRRNRVDAIVCLIVVPYCRAWLEDTYVQSQLPRHLTLEEEQAAALQEAREGKEGEQDGARAPVINYGARFARLKRRLFAWFVRWYPVMHAGWEGLHFLFELLYLVRATDYFSPLLLLTRQKVVRLSMQNMMEQMTRRRARRATRMEQVWQQGTVQNGGSLGYMRFLASSLMQTVADYGKYGVLLAICAFKFFEWYYSDANRLTQERKLPIPPAPPVLKAHPESAVEVKDHGKAGDCLLCHRPRTNEACASSGYVFCYPCIYGYVSEHGKCPVTLLNCKVAGIRKIYDADN